MLVVTLWLCFMVCFRYTSQKDLSITSQMNKIAPNSGLVNTTRPSSTISTKSHREKFLLQLKSIMTNIRDDNYYCTSHLMNYSSHDLNNYWVLRNKKCLIFNDARISFWQAEKNCRKIPYSSRTYQIHKDELDSLLAYRNNSMKGIDLSQLYENLNNKNHEFGIWLNDNDYTKCSNASFGPVYKFDRLNCKNGCFECQSKIANANYFICSKPCEWRVDLNSFCNTMNKKGFLIEENLYYQRDQQIYVCKGELICDDFSCKCPQNKKYIKDKARCI